MPGVHGGDYLEYERLKELGAVEPIPPVSSDVDEAGRAGSHSETWPPLPDEIRYYDPQRREWRGPKATATPDSADHSATVKGAPFEA